MQETKNTSDLREGATPVIIVSWAIIISASIVSLVYFKNFLIPLLIAVILWYLILELRRLIDRIKIRGRSIPNFLNAMISTFVVILVLYGTVEVIFTNIEKLASNFPVYSVNISNSLIELEDALGFEKMDELFNSQSKTIQTEIAYFAGSFAGFVSKFFLIIIYLIFIFLEEQLLHNKIRLLLIRSKNKDNIMESIQKINQLFHDYVSVKVFTSFLTGAFSFVALLILGIDLPGLWAFVIFLLNFVPTIGSIVATLFPSIFSILQFGNFDHFALVLICVGIIQIFVGNFLEPRLIGNKLNISPIVILVSLTFWGYIWGIIGMILAVPIMAMVIIICSQFQTTQGIAIALSRNGELDLKDTLSQNTASGQ